MTGPQRLLFGSATTVVWSITISAGVGCWWWILRSNIVKRRRKEDRNKNCYEKLIGNTPMVKLERLSRLTKRNIYVKMESLNPGGTGKDRAALRMIQQAEATGQLPSPVAATRTISPTQQSNLTNTTTSSQNDKSDDDDNNNNNTPSSPPPLASVLSLVRAAVSRSHTRGLVVEGTSGSTGISLATLCAARGHACLVVLPDDQAAEKQQILQTLGAIVHIVPNAAISNPQHYVNTAKQIAQSINQENSDSRTCKAVFIDQFENTANFQVHYETTGPEIYQQCPNIDAFVMSSGTGGTIAGVGTYLKQQQRRRHQHRWWQLFHNNNDDDDDDIAAADSSRILVVLADPPGGAMYHRVEHGVAYAPEQRERGLKRHRYDTLAEGIGLDRLTANFSRGVDAIDRAIRVTDQEAVDMAHYLLQEEGLWVGSSSAMNVVAAIRTARSLPEEASVVTVICDAGQRHVTRFWNPDFIADRGLVWPGEEDRIPDCLSGLIT